MSTTISNEIERAVREHGLRLPGDHGERGSDICDRCALDSGIIDLHETDEGLVASQHLTGPGEPTWEPVSVEIATPSVGETCEWCAQASIGTRWNGRRWQPATARVRWTDHQPDVGWYVDVSDLEGNDIEDSMDVGFPVDVDQFGAEARDELEAALRAAGYRVLA